jgi:hypothetical protein
MSMVCPQCHGSYSQRLHCPACNVRLEYHTGASGRRPTLPGDRNAWQHSPWGRILIGLLLAQGLYYGLWHLGQALAGLLAVNSEAAHGIWVTLAGLLVLQGLQAVSLLAGGSLAGAGKRQGVAYGSLVGLINGLISVWTLHGNSQLYSAVLLYGQPILHTAFGAAGGLLGVLVWRPLAPVGAPAAPPGPVARSRSRSPFAGPVAWFRVLAGIGVALGGALWANVILDFILAASDGRLTLDSELQAHLVTWEISALAMILGSAWAGATTPNGLKQGLFVGLGTASVLLGIRLNGRGFHPEAVILTLTSALLLCVVGGWFGSQLFPPLVGYFGGKRLGTASF